MKVHILLQMLNGKVINYITNLCAFGLVKLFHILRKCSLFGPPAVAGRVL